MSGRASGTQVRGVSIRGGIDRLAFRSFRLVRGRPKARIRLRLRLRRMRMRRLRGRVGVRVGLSGRVRVRGRGRGRVRVRGRGRGRGRGRVPRARSGRCPPAGRRRAWRWCTPSCAAWARWSG